MEVQRYVFQSPYPTAVQVGRPDPQASEQTSQNEAVDQLADTGNNTLKEAQSYIKESTGNSVNVAVSTSNTGVADALETFQSLNAQTHASLAYGS